jgi:two-component system chemotaxis response regulator CheB
LTRVRVAIADDSTFLRQAVARMLEGQPGVLLTGVASCGEELLDHLESWAPDVVILDLSMPGIGGLATLDALMARRPTPVLILSTHSAKDAPLTIEALHRGALDFIDKQQYSLVDFDSLRTALLDKIRQLARRPGAVWAAANGPPAPLPAAGQLVPRGAPAGGGLDGLDGGGSGGGVAGEAHELLVLGASTGGPPAIETVLRDLGGGLPVPVAVVQHMPAGFTRSFAARLNTCLPMPVREAAHQEALAAGTVYVAPGGIHIRLARGRDGLRVLLSSTPSSSPHRPSVDLLFGSAAAVVGGRVIAAVLTGMGHDGAAGLAALAQVGAHTIAQDEATSAVYGMPRAALAAGGVREVLPLPRIGGRLRELLAAGWVDPDG